MQSQSHLNLRRDPAISEVLVSTIKNIQKLQDSSKARNKCMNIYASQKEGIISYIFRSILLYFKNCPNLAALEIPLHG